MLRKGRKGLLALQELGNTVKFENLVSYKDRSFGLHVQHDDVRQLNMDLLIESNPRMHCIINRAEQYIAITEILQMCKTQWFECGICF